MAITCITGIPRSGKSYYAMYLLYMSFIYEKPVTRLSKFLDYFLPRREKLCETFLEIGPSNYRFMENMDVKAKRLEFYEELEKRKKEIVTMKTKDELKEMKEALIAKGKW